MRIGILGAAGIAPRAMIEPVRRRRDCSVVAVAARDGARAATFAAEHRIPRSYQGYEALLADPGVDLVYNALPPSAHARWTIAALEAGKHVLCEKPFAMNAAEATAMVEAAARTGKRLIEAFHDTYHPVQQYLFSLRDRGELGEITALKAEFTSEIPFDPASIRHRPEDGGGALMDLGCYPLHWTRLLLQAEPTVLSAEAGLNPLGVDETITARLQFPSGLVTELSASMAAGVPFLPKLTIETTRGHVEVYNPILPHLGHWLRTTLGGTYSEFTLGGGTTYDHQLAAVLDGMNSGAPLLTEGADSIANMQAIGAIYAAAGLPTR